MSPTELLGSLTDRERLVAAAVAKFEGRLIEKFTPRERGIVILMCAGVKNIHISERVGISKGRVRDHAQTIYSKIGLNGGGPQKRATFISIVAFSHTA